MANSNYLLYLLSAFSQVCHVASGRSCLLELCMPLYVLLYVKVLGSQVIHFGLVGDKLCFVGDIIDS